MTSRPVPLLDATEGTCMIYLVSGTVCNIPRGHQSHQDDDFGRDHSGNRSLAYMEAQHRASFGISEPGIYHGCANPQ